MRNLILIIAISIMGCAKDKGQNLNSITSPDGGAVDACEANKVQIAQGYTPSFSFRGTMGDAFDGNKGSFIYSYNVAMNDTMNVAFRLTAPSYVECVKFTDDYTNQYSLGDLEVLVSSNSTDGENGTWSLASTMNNANTSFVNGDGVIHIGQSALWIKLRMKYTGTGAFGASPAFYLSEFEVFEGRTR